MTNLSKLKKATLFKFPGKKAVYVFSGKVGRGKAQKFAYYRYDDISADFQTSIDRSVEVDFDF